MKRMLALVAAVAVTALVGASNAQAQDYVGGYQFGAGLQSQCGGGFYRGYTPREQPPYFAQYPPVYYSHIVPRPYGVSPYAAPAGIAPVEMSIPIPVTVKNPFYQGEVEQVSEESNAIDETPAATNNQSTMKIPVWISNPHLSRS